MSDQPKRRPVSGPALPPHLKMGKQAIKGTEAPARTRSRSPSRNEDKRESWMTEAPKNKITSDPLSLKARQFQKKSSETETITRTKDEEAYDERQEEYVRSYNEQFRQESLVDVHRREYGKEKAEAQKEDLDRRIFDWERDMNQGTKAGSSKDTNELLSKFGTINSRFSSSSKKRFL